MSKPRLQGKVALVTGAASGIGKEAARLFAENGAFVVIVDIQDELGEQLLTSIGTEKCRYIHCDVREEIQVEAAINFTFQNYGTLDVLFSNAGIMGPLTGVLDMDLAQFDNTFATNVRGVAATLKHVGRAMMERQIRGSIICTSSISGCIGGVGPAGYTVSKHALLGLARAACGELGAFGIRVNCISPFGVATPLSCNAYKMESSEIEQTSSAVVSLKGVVLKAKDVAEAALFLASDESAFISGQNLVVDGGFTAFSGPSTI